MSLTEKSTDADKYSMSKNYMYRNILLPRPVQKDYAVYIFSITYHVSRLPTCCVAPFIPATHIADLNIRTGVTARRLEVCV